MSSGWGLNGGRTRLRKILADPRVIGIVVERGNRLSRFGVEHREAALVATGREVMVVNRDEVKTDLVRGMVEVLPSMCARLYARRSARCGAGASVRCATAAEVAG
jgi:putative resolvase